jgi:hypothetical protein
MCRSRPLPPLTDTPCSPQPGGGGRGGIFLSPVYVPMLPANRDAQISEPHCTMLHTAPKDTGHTITCLTGYTTRV